MKKYKFVLFDLDGTLFDYDQAETDALTTTFEESSSAFEPSYLEEYRIVNKKMWLDFEKGLISQKELRTKRFEELGKILGIELDSISYSANYLKNLSLNAGLIEGAEALIQTLAEYCELVMITNGLKEVQRSRIAQSTIHHHFREVIISEEIGFAKPDPRIFDATFEKLNKPKKNETIIIGDSLTSDIAGGINYGIDTCWFNPKKAKNHLAIENIQPKYEIESLDELHTILQK